MRQSELFVKTRREAPKDEEAINARLLIRAGFVHKAMAGVWNYLPLGFRVLQKINSILREEMDRAGGQELMLTALQPKALWETTGRWEELKDVMYQFEDNSGHALGLAITHEEPLAETARNFISSYKDLPLYLYQIQTKFRNEPRAKSGLLRSREFLMKDLYSFDKNEESLNQSYEKLKKAYIRFFERVGLQAKIVEASGGAFTKDFTHEFQVIADAGEDEIVYCEKCDFAQNKEIAAAKKGESCPDCAGALFKTKSIEVGHIYKLGTKYSEPLNLYFIDEKGERRPVFMGSYGIGPGRVMGAIVETYHDEKGMIWPESVSPFLLHLLDLGRSGRTERSEKVYQDLSAHGGSTVGGQKAGIEVLYDDREDANAGEKLMDADLIGIPWRLVISEKTGDKIEVKRRGQNEVKLVDLKELLKEIRDER